MSNVKKVINFFKVWDGLWSIPVAIFVFMGTGYAIVSLFGAEAGSMLPVYTQRLFYAALCLVVCNFVTLFGMFINFRHNFRFITKDQWHDGLSATMKLKVSLVIYFGYFLFFALCLIFV